MQPQRAMALTRAHFRQAHWLQRQALISITMGQYAALPTPSLARVRRPAVAIPAPVIQRWRWRLWTCAQGAIRTASISQSKHLPRSQTLMPVVWPLPPKSTYFLLLYPYLKRTIICIRDSRSSGISVIWIWMVKALSRLSLRPSVNSTLVAQSWSISCWPWSCSHKQTARWVILCRACRVSGIAEELEAAAEIVQVV